MLGGVVAEWQEHGQLSRADSSSLIRRAQTTRPSRRIVSLSPSAAIAPGAPPNISPSASTTMIS
eukprot:4787320-Prymnesium_polylepis.1